MMREHVIAEFRDKVEGKRNYRTDGKHRRNKTRDKTKNNKEQEERNKRKVNQT